jgi:hypothetical protein
MREANTFPDKVYGVIHSNDMKYLSSVEISGDKVSYCSA